MERINPPFPPEVIAPEPHDRIAGNWNDDDGQAIDAYFEAADHTPIEYDKVLEPTDKSTPAATRLLTKSFTLVSPDGVNPAAPLMLLPADPNRKSVALQFSLAAAAVTASVYTILNQASAAQVANGNSPALNVAGVTAINLDVNVTAVAGVGPQLQLFIDRAGADGIWYQIYASAVINAVGTVSTSIGTGAATNQTLGNTLRFRWTVAGGGGQSFTFSASITSPIPVTPATVAASSAGLRIGSAKADVYGAPKLPQNVGGTVYPIEDHTGALWVYNDSTNVNDIITVVAWAVAS